MLFKSKEKDKPFESAKEQDLWQVPENDKIGIYTKYKNQIYTCVPGNGNEQLVEADFNTFHLLYDNKLGHEHIAVDQYRAYCGNRVIPEMNP